MAFLLDFIRGKDYIFNIEKSIQDAINGALTGSTMAQVETYADLPDPTTVPNQIYFVRTSSSFLYFFDRKPSGFYYSNGAIWTYAGDFPTLFGDTVFRIYDSDNTSREIAFIVDNISDATTRYISMPDNDINLGDINNKFDKTGGTISGDIIVTGQTNLNTLTAKTITDVDYFQFNNDYTGNTIVEGRMYWDEPNGSVSLGMHGSNVLQQIGLEYYYYIKNQSGSTIQNGRVVRASGTLGSSGRLLGEYMIADGSVEAKYSLGVATEDIVDGDDGYVTEFGLVRGVNTTGSLYGETWVDGDILWVSPTISGGLTKFEPQPPNLKIEMAIVINSAVNGSIFVRPHRYPYLRDLQGIIITGETSGDILQYNGGFWENTSEPYFNSLSANSITANTYFSGTTDISNIFELKNISSYRTQILTSGATFSFSSFTGINTISINKTVSSNTAIILGQTPNINDFFIVKDRKGDSDLFPITISGGTYTIDGNTSVQLKQNNKPSLTFLFDGDEYIII